MGGIQGTLGLSRLCSFPAGDLDLGLITFKGCASPAMCQSSLLALVQELENTNVLCCQGNLCNTRIIDGVVTEPKIPADSSDLSEAHGCIPLTTPSGPTPNPECDYVDYDEDIIVEAPVPGQVFPHPNTGKEEVDTISEKEGSEVDNASPVGSADTAPAAADGSSATADLHKSESGASSTSSGSHGNVVVLVPIIIPRKNTTAASASSSSPETTDKEDLEASNRDESEADECEAEEEDSSEDLVAAPEDNTVSSYGFTPRPGPAAASSHGTANVVAAIGENVIAGGGTPLPATELGASTPGPLSYILSRDNESFVIAGEAEMGTNALPATNSPSEAVFASGAGVESSPPPKKKIPCKRPRQPGANPAPSSRVNNHVAERSVEQTLQLSETKDTGKTHYSSRAFSSAGNLGLLSLALLLAVLLH